MTGCDTYFIGRTGEMECLDTLEKGLQEMNSGSEGYLWLNYSDPAEETLARLV